MFQKQLLRILWNKKAPRLIRKILRKYHAEKLKVFLKSPKGFFFYKLLSSCVKVKQVCELIGQICLMAWHPISNTGQHKIWWFNGRTFLWTTLRCWSRKSKSFCFTMSGFFLKFDWDLYHFRQNSIASDGVKIENSRNYEHNMELKLVFFVNLFQ